MHPRDGPPFRAVASLTLVVAHHWRTIRGKLILAGHRDPLVDLVDLHALLDVAEVVVTENMEAKDLNTFNLRMYRPQVQEGVVDRTPPAGFSEEEQDSAFAAFGLAVSAVERTVSRKD